MKEPSLIIDGGAYKFWFSDEDVLIIVSRVSTRDGVISGEISVISTMPGITSHILPPTRLGLTSSQARRTLINDVKKMADQIKWDEIINMVVGTVIERYRHNSPINFLSSDTQPEPSRFLLEPLIYEGKPNLLFGEGGTGKSYLALALGLCINCPELAPAIDCKALRQGNVLYLDYESDENEAHWRIHTLNRGFQEDGSTIIYRQCSLPFCEDMENIEEIVHQYNIILLIIDSLGVASGAASINDAPTATALFSALRRFKVTSLLITHVSKDASNKNSTPIGSIFFSNLARNIWEVKKQEEENQSSSVLGLFHRKNNQGKRFNPYGLRLSFNEEEEKTIVKSENIRNIDEFVKFLGLRYRIERVLQEGKKSIVDIVNELEDVNKNSVKTTLYRYDQVFTKLSKTEWGLKARED